MKKPIYAYFRQTGKSQKIYIIFNDSEGNIVFRRSLEQIYREESGDFWGSPVNGKKGEKALKEAEKYCQNLLAKGYFKEDLERKRRILENKGDLVSVGLTIPFVDYCRKFWDFDNSDWVKRRKREKSDTISKSYVKDKLSVFVNHVEKRLPEGLSLGNFQPFYAERIKDAMMKEEVSNSTINKAMGAIRQPLEEAFRLGYLKENVSARIANVATNAEKERGILTDKETGELLQYLKDNKKGIDRWEYLIVRLGVETGARENEISTLKLDDFTPLDDNSYKVRIDNSYNKADGIKATKTKKNRTVTCSKELALEVITYAESFKKGSDLIFSKEKDNDTPKTNQEILRAFYNALKAIGIDEEERKERNIVFHSLRHGHAVMMDGVADLRTLKLATGHTSDTMALHYSDHETEKDLRILAEARAKGMANYNL